LNNVGVIASVMTKRCMSDLKPSGPIEHECQLGLSIVMMVGAADKEADSLR
jgi:hypothetical protein